MCSLTIGKAHDVNCKVETSNSFKYRNVIILSVITNDKKTWHRNPRWHSERYIPETKHNIKKYDNLIGFKDKSVQIIFATTLSIWH